ncbi:MAG: hypothetical protein NTW08_02105 [Gammaproteobacteria bacterium]|nr:hypothetical protein [Gammaproteobacteria bacterium]
MEKSNTRVLGFQLAQVIPDDMLQDVSGGGFHLSYTSTFHESGPQRTSDVGLDVTEDA